MALKDPCIVDCNPAECCDTSRIQRDLEWHIDTTDFDIDFRPVRHRLVVNALQSGSFDLITSQECDIQLIE